MKPLAPARFFKAEAVAARPGGPPATTSKADADAAREGVPVRRPGAGAPPSQAAHGAAQRAPAPAGASATRAADAPDRLVFFFSGFDPKGASFYHRLFRNGTAQRNATHADSLTVGQRIRIGGWASAWTVLWRNAPQAQAHAEGVRSARTRLHFMRWDDIVRAHWQRRPLQLVRDYWNVYAHGISSGVFKRIRSKSRSAWLLALFPLGVALASLLAGLVVVGGLLAVMRPLPAWGAVVGGLAAGLLAWRLVARWIDCEWLLRLYAFTRLQALGALPALEKRLDDMADRLVEAVEARLRQPGALPLREVLVVGYSTGSTMAAAVLARALERLETLFNGRGVERGTTLGLLTLGHCIPVAADWGGAHRTRAELRQLADCAALTWHDYSSPADWAAFSRTPPWPEPARLHGHQASPRFHAHLGALEYAALRRDRREMHLQYLRPPIRQVEAEAYDYFLLTAGPMTLAERHAALGTRKRAPA
jgi:hypothetical protein